MSQKLSSLIAKQIALYPPPPKANFWHALYFPSIPLVRGAFLSLILVVILSQLPISAPFLSWLFTPSSDINSNLLVIHAGIGAIIFALLIFVAESLRDDDSKDRARVLLRESMLFPITLLEILVFFIFIAGKVNYFAALPVIGVGLLTIASVYKTVAVLLNKTEFAKKRREVLRERLRYSLDGAIKTRFGQNLFQEAISSEPRIVCRSYYSKKRPGREIFTAKRYGTVTDIDIDALKEAVEIIAGENSVRNAKEVFGNSTEVSEDENKQKQSAVLVVAKQFHADISPSNNILCYFDGIIAPIKKQEAEALIDRAFTIEQHAGFSEAVRNDMSAIKDQMLTAIIERHSGKAKELVDIYIELFQEFLECLSRFKGNYSSEQARNELHSIGGGWQEVSWLRNDIREIFIKAIATEDYQLAEEIVYLPIAISKEALGYKDQYVFQTFIGFSRLLYLRVAESKNSEFKDIMEDLASRQLTEIAHYVIQPRLREHAELNAKDELVALKEFAIYLFVIFQGLLKDSFGKNDLPGFTKYKTAAAKLFDHLGEGLGDDPVEVEIMTKRRQLFFHLASWLADSHVQASKNTDCLKYYQLADAEVPSDLNEIDALFWAAHDRDAEDFWGWSWWGLEDDGEVHTVDVFGRLERYYIIKMLETLTNLPPQNIIQTVLQPRREYAHLVAKDGGFGAFINGLKDNPQKCAGVVSDEMLQQIPALEKIFQVAIETYKAQELDKIRKDGISSKKVEEFRRDVLAGLKENPCLRNVLLHLDLITDKTTVSRKSDKRFGVNTVFDKTAFFEKWHVYYGDLGKRYGESIATGENAFLLDKIAEKCSEINNLSDLSLDGNSWFVLTTDSDWKRFFEAGHEDASVKSESEPDHAALREYEGVCLIGGKKVPVFYVFRKENKKQFIIVNSRRFGRVTYYSPLNAGEDRAHVSGGLYINVRAFSESKSDLDALLNTPPDWLKTKGDAAAQTTHLLEHVLVNILEKFEYIPGPRFTGYSLKITKPSRYSR